MTAPARTTGKTNDLSAILGRISSYLGEIAIRIDVTETTASKALANGNEISTQDVENIQNLDFARQAVSDLSTLLGNRSIVTAVTEP